MKKGRLYETNLYCFVKYTASDLHDLQVLFLVIARAFDVSHPAAMILLAGIDEIAHRAIFIENLRTTKTLAMNLWLGMIICEDKTSLCMRHLLNVAYLPHEIVVLEEIHMLGWNDPACEGTHLGASFYPGLGEDAKSFSRDWALRNDDLTWQH